MQSPENFVMTGQGRIPVVAIVGRPNVGKSSLFNRLVGNRISIEDPRPGTTRDRVSFHLRLGGRLFDLVDAAGVGMIDEQSLEKDVGRQIGFAVSQADVLIMVVDMKQGLLPLDQQAARQVRASGKPVILVANKSDAPHHDQLAGEFHRLGLGDPLAASAAEFRGIFELRDAILAALPPRTDAEEESPPVMRLAIVGKRNSGKSSFVNRLVGDERVIVSEHAGTTRDSIDVHVEHKGMHFVLIDTAGLQRERSVANSVEFFSQARAIKALRRADVSILMMDCGEETSRLDRKLAEEAVHELKPVVVAVNKWDIAEERGVGPEKYMKYISTKLPMLSFAPVVFCSAKTGFNCLELVDLALDLHRQAHSRVSTGELNRAVRAAFDLHRPKARGGKPPRLFFATQVEINPPTIVCFVNDAEMFGDDYREYLKNKLRESLPYREVPIKVIFRNREKVELEDDA
jgi:GTP-binding protein